MALHMPTVTLASKEQTLSGEILWTLRAVTSHYSYNSSSESAQLFSTMFPDSKVVAAFSCCAAKIGFLAKYGIAPFFREQLIGRVKASSQFVVLFAQSLNDTTQTKQMDIHVWFWDGDTVRTVHTLPWVSVPQPCLFR